MHCNKCWGISCNGSINETKWTEWWEWTSSSKWVHENRRVLNGNKSLYSQDLEIGKCNVLKLGALILIFIIAFCRVEGQIILLPNLNAALAYFRTLQKFITLYDWQTFSQLPFCMYHTHRACSQAHRVMPEIKQTPVQSFKRYLSDKIRLISGKTL